MDLKVPLKELGIVYKLKTKQLDRLEIKTLEDLLLHLPFRYENYSIVAKISSAQPGEILTIKGSVLDITSEWTRQGKKIQIAIISDETKKINCIWFNQQYILKSIKKGDAISVAGKVNFFRQKLAIFVSEYEAVENINDPTYHTGRLVPIYPETYGISSKWIRNRIKQILENYSNSLIEYFPYSIIERNNLIEYKTAIEQIHFPKNMDIVKKSRFRLAFDELFLTQLAALYRKSQWEKNRTSTPFNVSGFQSQIQNFYKSLPFALTNAQKKALLEIFTDLAKKRPMNRLLEGDVGSGKTVIATAVMYLAYLNGFKSVLMAPTDILARQHYETVSGFLSCFGIKVELVTGTKKQKEENKDSNIFIGTHALIGKKIEFKKLGLVVIDEQQRFGVEQRSILRKKGANPHFLTMTATPIPRTVFLTLYGDLDLSYLDEMPKGRKRVKTFLVPGQKREKGYEWIKKMIKEKNQVFIICPFIEESESIKTVKAATQEYLRLKKTVFKDFNIGLLHGRLKQTEREKILQEFAQAKFDILVSTPVVEVGIDIKNATIIVIEAAERFGLANLHQLRGRVGRGEKQSYCLLFTNDKTNSQTSKRLKLLESIHDGAKLAEWDIKLRGPGQIYGVLQHGQIELKIASFSDFALIQKTKKEAQDLFTKLADYPLLQEKVKSTIIEDVSPD